MTMPLPSLAPRTAASFGGIWRQGARLPFSKVDLHHVMSVAQLAAGRVGAAVGAKEGAKQPLCPTSFHAALHSPAERQERGRVQEQEQEQEQAQEQEPAVA